MATQNYTLGRGKVHFSRFKAGTQIPKGFFYIGNTPEFNLTIESETLDHFSSDEGIREKDDSVPLEVSRSGSLITDNIDPKNVALFYFGSADTVTQLSATDQEETLTGVMKGHSYKLGSTASNPAGYFGLNALGFSVAPAGVALVKAAGTLTLSGVGSNGDTVTIGSTVYTFKTVPVDPYDVDIGADATGSAANLVAAINAGAGAGTAYGTGTAAHPDVSASNAAGVITATAREGGTPSNSIATLEVSSAMAWGAATLAGGTGAAYVEGTDYSVNYSTGQIEILDTGSITENSDIDVVFSVRASTRARIISGSEPVEGAMQYIAANPKGSNFNYYLPWVKITPNGDYALKGDEWQQIPFSIEALKPVGAEAIYVDGVPAFV